MVRLVVSKATCEAVSEGIFEFVFEFASEVVSEAISEAISQVALPFCCKCDPLQLVKALSGLTREVAVIRQANNVTVPQHGDEYIESANLDMR